MTEQYNSIEQRVSYGIGRQMGEQLIAQPFDGLDVDALTAGLQDALNNKPNPIDPKLLQEAFQVMGERMEAKQAEQGSALAAEGEAFLANNAKRDEVTVLPSGLQYEVVNTGSGTKPSATSKVRTHYHGTLIDGTVFDSSYERGEPAEFPVNGVIAGWTEALQLMTVGTKWRLYIPHQLAYGDQGAGPQIGPCSALIFDVELLDIVG